MTVIDDTYTGHVEPGAAARRILPGATIVKVSVGPMDNNAYLVTCSRTGATLLVDAANDAPLLLDVIAQTAAVVDLIVTSHQHGDHWQALEEVAASTGAPTAAHSLDAGPLPVTPDRILADGDTITVGDLSLDVIHLQGHTEGSVALALSGPAAGDAVQLFTGDCLFPGGVGRTWCDGDFDRLLDGVSAKVFAKYADNTVVYPGHGDDTTLGAERPHLAEWRERGGDMIPRPTPDEPGPGRESVWDYPRPPRLEEFRGSITVELGGERIAETTRGWRVLETSHPPTYYLPADAFRPGVLRAAGGSSWCEWKGQARYFDLVTDRAIAASAAWTYPQPTRGFVPLAGALAVMAAAVDRCTVNGEDVTPQPGGFYGGWITSWVVGPFKGVPGSMGW